MRIQVLELPMQVRTVGNHEEAETPYLLILSEAILSTDTLEHIRETSGARGVLAFDTEVTVG